MRILGHVTYAAFCAAFLLGGAACGGDEADLATSDDSLNGPASYTYYSCVTAATFGNNTWRYRVDAFNNTASTITLIATPAPGYGDPVFPNLAKLTTNTWSDNTGYTVKLVQRTNGRKSIEVVDHRFYHTASRENGSCNSQVICPEYQALSNGRCVYTGETTPDVYGNFILETVAAAPAGVLVRIGNGVIGSLRAGIVVARPTVAAQAPAIIGASSEGEALAALEQRIGGLNPLSGTKAVGNGNCFNEALTQAVTLLTGKSVCATPYYLGQNNTNAKLAADARALLGGSRSTPWGTFEGVRSYLGQQLGDGQIALLISDSPQSAHATLVARIHGQLVHINNQNWTKVTQFDNWGYTWARAVRSNETTYKVLTVFDGHILP
jgi:hypothetical protein